MDDPTILQWAADHDRALINHDIRTMPDFALQRVAAAQSMSGVFVVPTTMSIRTTISELSAIAAASEPSESVNRVVNLPLR